MEKKNGLERIGDFIMYKFTPVAVGLTALFLDPIMENVREFSGNRTYFNYSLFKEKTDSLENMHKIQIDSLNNIYQKDLDNLRSRYKRK